MSTKTKSAGQVLAGGGTPVLSVVPDDVVDPYFQRQKVTLTGSSTVPVDPTKWGDTIKFAIHGTERGVKLYPGSASEITLKTPNDPGPWTMDGYVDRVGVTTDFLIETEWTPPASGDTVPPGKGALPGIVKRSDISGWLPVTKMFKPAAGFSPPTDHGDNQLEVSVLYVDPANANATIQNKAMMVGVTIGQKGTPQDFDNFTVYPWDYSSTTWSTSKAPPDPAENESQKPNLVVDSAATGDALVKFAIVPGVQGPVWSTAELWYGSTSQTIATLLIADSADATGWDDSLPMLKAAEEQGGILTLDGLATLHLTFDDSGDEKGLQDGDIFFVIINGNFIPTPRTFHSQLDVVATIPADSNNIQSGDPPEKNTLQYVAYRPTDPNAAIFMSGQYVFYATGNSEVNRPPHPPNAAYPAPKIEQQTAPILTADMITGGMTVKVKFGSKVPSAGDTICAHFYTNGWHDDGTPYPDQPQFQYTMTATDHTNKSCEIPCDPESFAGYGRDYLDTGSYPTMVLQYEVTPGGGGDTQYSELLETKFLTILLGH